MENPFFSLIGGFAAAFRARVAALSSERLSGRLLDFVFPRADIVREL